MPFMGFQVFKAVNTNITVSWNVVMSSSGDWYLNFGGTHWNDLWKRWTPPINNHMSYPRKSQS